MSSHPFKHLHLVIKHRHQVIKNGFHMGIFFHCLKHDLSKFTPLEFFRSSKYYRGNGSPIFFERIHNDYYSIVCEHHTKRNKHHWEYYTDFLAGRIIARNMPYKYCIEYVADVLSASKTYNKKDFNSSSALLYFEKVGPQYYMTDGTREFITECFKRYKDNRFKDLKKKKTKILYNEIMSKYPSIKIFTELYLDTPLPPLIKDEK